MPKASVKRLIDNKKDKLIDFVLDIEKYPEFVPFCQGSKVYERKQEGDLTLIIADLTIGKGPFVDTYKSDVKFNKKNENFFNLHLFLNEILFFRKNFLRFRLIDSITYPSVNKRLSELLFIPA